MDQSDIVLPRQAAIQAQCLRGAYQPGKSREIILRRARNSGTFSVNASFMTRRHPSTLSRYDISRMRPSDFFENGRFCSKRHSPRTLSLRPLTFRKLHRGMTSEKAMCCGIKPLKRYPTHSPANLSVPLRTPCSPKVKETDRPTPAEQPKGVRYFCCSAVGNATNIAVGSDDFRNVRSLTEGGGRSCPR